MLKKYSYYIDYFARDIVVLFVAFVLLDFCFEEEELSISRNIITAIVFSVVFFLLFSNPIIRRLNNAGYQIKSFRDMANINPEIVIDSIGIDELIGVLKASKHFTKAEFVTQDHNKLIVIKKQLFWKITDVYTYTQDRDAGKMTIQAELTKLHYRKDSRRLIDLALIDSLMTAQTGTQTFPETTV